MRLFLNEQISPVVSSRLRERGFDVVSPHDLATRSLSDSEQFARATADPRAVVTYNIADFLPLANQSLARGQDHFGLILVSEPRSEIKTGAGIGKIAIPAQYHVT